MKRAFIELSFAWLLGIIAGAAILTLAIFAATRLINIGQSATGVETQSKIAVLLNPLETSFQTGQVTSITLPVETRIMNECDDRSGIFGEQRISVSQQNLGKWSSQTPSTNFQNKYIFSEGIVEGKKFLLFSKPFDFPFKISDLIYMTSESEYCFVNPPEAIHEELDNLQQENIILANSLTNCSSSNIKVCFKGEDCSINVNYNQGIVDKNGSKMVFYGDALMYGAIFSDKTVYECQLKRLMQRGAQLSSLYIQKSDTIGNQGCTSGLTSELTLFSSLTNSFADSEDINDLISLTNNMQEKNDLTRCKLW